MKSQRQNPLLSSLLCLALVCAALWTADASAQNKTAATDGNTPKYRNPNITIDERVADLLPRMTLEEKVQQISGGGRGQLEIIDPTGTFNAEKARATMSQ